MSLETRLEKRNHIQDVETIPITHHKYIPDVKKLHSKHETSTVVRIK